MNITEQKNKLTSKLTKEAGLSFITWN